jgi:zinc/manganese transport system ATP-binding protein
MTEAVGLAGRLVSQLSGGELQRLLLAQALLGRPKLLLLDEPLMNLDPRYQQSVIELVKQLQTKLGITVLLSAHELNPLLEVMDGVLYLGNGQGAFGPVESVITGEVLSRLYETPIDVVRLGSRIFVMSAHGNVEADAHHHA